MAAMAEEEDGQLATAALRGKGNSLPPIPGAAPRNHLLGKSLSTTLDGRQVERRSHRIPQPSHAEADASMIFSELRITPLASLPVVREPSAASARTGYAMLLDDEPDTDAATSTTPSKSTAALAGVGGALSNSKGGQRRKSRFA
jgi:hypothetical protein